MLIIIWISEDTVADDIKYKFLQTYYQNKVVSIE